MSNQDQQKPIDFGFDPKLNLLSTINWQIESGCFLGWVIDSPEWVDLLGSEETGTLKWLTPLTKGQDEYGITWKRRESSVVDTPPRTINYIDFRVAHIISPLVRTSFVDSSYYT
jgi:hypothetical protein